jgi:hypothetical protein
MTELIQTKRLDLHLIPPLELFMLHEDPDNPALLSDRGFTNPHNELTHEHSGPLRWRVPQVKANPDTNVWFIRWIVNGEVVGSNPTIPKEKTKFLECCNREALRLIYWEF